MSNLKSKIKFNKDIDNPIFTMTIKDFNGIEIKTRRTFLFVLEDK